MTDESFLLSPYILVESLFILAYHNLVIAYHHVFSILRIVIKDSLYVTPSVIFRNLFDSQGTPIFRIGFYPCFYIPPTSMIGSRNKNHFISYLGTCYIID